MKALVDVRPAADLSGPSLKSWFLRAIDAMQVWHQRVRQRRQLRSLDGHMLRDIGLDRTGAEQEIAKSFWKA